MADQYTASMFGLDSPYWKDKYGWDYQRDERYPEKLDDSQENSLLAEGLNMAGITPDMDLGDIRKKYKSEFKGVSNEEIHSFLDDVFTKAGIDTGFTYGDANSMFRKFLNLKGMLREPDKKDWPTIDIPYWRDPVASIDTDVWDEKMRRGDVVETIEWVDPGQQVGPGGVPSFDNTGIYNQDLSISDFKDLGIGGAGKFTRMVESMTTQELFDAGYIDAIEKEERVLKDRRHQQGVEEERRARQYDAIAQRLST